MQQILNVITPAETYDLVTLEQMKIKLGIPDTNTATDALLQELITNISAVIAKMCNRVFAYEEVEETFYQLNDESGGWYGRPPPTQRLYLSRWPVVSSDIQSMTHTVDGSGTYDDLLSSDFAGTWILEQETGTLYRRPDQGPWVDTIDIVYSGGYDVPENTPATLLFALEAVIRESYMSWIRSTSVFGVRQLAHKESRISYYGPNMFPTMGLPATWTQVEALLSKYIRHWV